MKQTMAIAVAGLLAASSALAVAETAANGDPAKAEQIATQMCAACHGADGNSVVPAFPKLAGQHPEYLTKQLNNFKTGERANPIMMGMVAALAPEDMSNLGAYFASKPAAAGTVSNPELARQGQKIFKGGIAATGVAACAACHSPNGAGIPAQFPRLSGQHADYIAVQLTSFRSGERANDSGKMMRMIAARMTDQEIKAVAEYIAGLR